MFVSTQGRLAGRTTKMIEYIRNHEQVLFVTHSLEQEQHLHKKYPELIKQIIWWSRLIHEAGSIGYPVEQKIIAEAELLSLSAKRELDRYFNRISPAGM